MKLTSIFPVVFIVLVFSLIAGVPPKELVAPGFFRGLLATLIGVWMAARLAVEQYLSQERLRLESERRVRAQRTTAEIASLLRTVEEVAVRDLVSLACVEQMVSREELPTRKFSQGVYQALVSASSRLTGESTGGVQLPGYLTQLLANAAHMVDNLNARVDWFVPHQLQQNINGRERWSEEEAGRWESVRAWMIQEFKDGIADGNSTFTGLLRVCGLSDETIRNEIRAGMPEELDPDSQVRPELVPRLGDA